MLLLHIMEVVSVMMLCNINKSVVTRTPSTNIIITLVTHREAKVCGIVRCHHHCCLLENFSKPPKFKDGSVCLESLGGSG
jgi:hypothetical protein